MRWWSKVVATELAKIDEDIKVRVWVAIVMPWSWLWDCNWKTARSLDFDLTDQSIQCSSCFAKVNITAATAADKILELEQVQYNFQNRECFYVAFIHPWKKHLRLDMFFVCTKKVIFLIFNLLFKVLTSISTMREKLQEAVSNVNWSIFEEKLWFVFNIDTGDPKTSYNSKRPHLRI